MTFEEADGGKVNPFYSLGENFTKNCQACIAAFEARLKGFSVRAKPFDDNNIYFKRLSLNPAKAFIDPYTKHHPVWMESPIFINAEDCISYIKKIVKRNQRYVMRFIWEYNKRGHVISIIRTNKGKLFFYDPQDSSIYERKDFLDLFKSIYFEEKYKQPQFFRTDYLQFDVIFDNTNKIKFYILISKKEENLYLGWPTIIKEIDGVFSEIKNNKEKLKIMNLPKVQ